MVRGKNDNDGSDAAALLRRLRVVVEKLHRDPLLIRSDPRVFAALVRLYPFPVREIWQRAVEPYVLAQWAMLDRLYDEHAALPVARVLDLVEAPLVLERLDHDVRRLERAWPLGHSLLDEVASSWGVPVGQTA